MASVSSVFPSPLAPKSFTFSACTARLISRAAPRLIMFNKHLFMSRLYFLSPLEIIIQELHFKFPRHLFCTNGFMRAGNQYATILARVIYLYSVVIFPDHILHTRPVVIQV